ncbi:MAG TPA: HAD family hydrolase [Bacillota bacterium]|nr:HAD family hydrolase [Bacillota bacterium]
MYKAVFLDRDGVVNDNTKFVNHPDDLVLYPWTADSIRRLKDEGFLVFLATNQGGIEMGHFSEADLQAIHAHLQALLKKKGAELDAIAYCPHFRKACSCRKPKPGMILDLADRFQVDLDQSWMIGDRPMDIQAGQAAGCRTIKLGEPEETKADYVCHRLDEAVNFITGN